MRPRSPALAPFVASMGYLEGRFPHGRERVLPTGTVQLLVNLDRDALHCAPDGLPPVRTGGAAGRPVAASRIQTAPVPGAATQTRPPASAIPVGRPGT